MRRNFRRLNLTVPIVIAAGLLLMIGCAEEGDSPLDSEGSLRMYNWSVRSLTGGAQYQGLQIAAGNSRVGIVANLVSGPSVLISTSDGLAWTQGVTLGLSEVRGIEFAAGRFHVLGSPMLLRSEDLIVWDTTAWPNGDNCACLLQSMAFTGSSYLAVGPTTAGFSSDGKMWSRYDKSIISTDFSTLRKTTYQNNRMVLMVINRDSSTTDFLQSTNLATWTVLSSIPSTTINDFAPKGNGAVAVGEEGQVWFSNDLTTWLPGNSGTLEDLVAVEYANNQFMATGTGGKIIGSKLGDEWTDMPTGTTANLHDIKWTGTRYVATGVNVLLASD